MFSKWITLLLAGFSFLFLFFILYQHFIGPLGNNPLPNWILIIIFLLFLGLTFNFISLVLKITPEFILVGYGLYKHEITWDRVKRCYKDQASNVSYGGWGIRFGRVEGQWRLVYNIPESKRLVLSLKEGTFREFVFSTRNPDEVLRIIREQADID